MRQGAYSFALIIRRDIPQRCSGILREAAPGNKVNYPFVPLKVDLLLLSGAFMLLPAQKGTCEGVQAL